MFRQCWPRLKKDELFKESSLYMVVNDLDFKWSKDYARGTKKKVSA